MLKKIYQSLLVLFIATVLSGCHPFNPSIMFKTPKDFAYTPIPQDIDPEYRIAPFDIIELRLYTNNGFRLIDMMNLTSTGGGGNLNQSGGLLQFLVEKDGQVNLPTIGRVQIAGKTIREAQFFLEEKYDPIYEGPFAIIKVINRRVMVFPGNEGAGTVITLTNNNTTLIEALAMAGGIADRGKAYKVKLIRGDYKNPQIYLIDLETIDGIKDANMIIQANDIIYVEPIKVTRREVLGEITPILSLITGLITLGVVINALR